MRSRLGSIMCDRASVSRRRGVARNFRYSKDISGVTTVDGAGSKIILARAVRERIGCYIGCSKFSVLATAAIPRTIADDRNVK